MDRTRSAHGGDKKCLQNTVLVGMPVGTRSLGRPWRRWEDNIKMDLTEIGWDAQDKERWRAIVNTVMTS
jgi:hypothetical protein